MSLCGYLKADTSVIVTVGPFVDVGDGFTPQTDITLSGDEAELIKHGSTAVVDISARTWAAVTSCRGYYSLTLTTADTDTEGMLTIIVQDDSDCLPVRCDFEVVSANVYDSLFAAATTDYLQVDTIQVSGTSQTANDNGADINAILDDTDLIDDGTSGLAKIASDVAAVLVDTAEIGVAGAGLTNINLPNQTMDITGNITGNLSGSVGSVTGHTNQTGDSYAIVNHVDYGNAKLVRSTTPANALDVAATGEAGLDFNNIKAAEAATTLTNITVPTCTTNTDMRGTDSAATATALATAQSDLDTLTGTDGATLATSQPNYAPNKVVPDAAGVAPTAVEIRQEIDTNSTRLDANMTSRAPASEYDTEMARITANVATASALTTAQTDLDTLTDAAGEPAQGAPPVSASMKDKINYIYKFLRNKVLTTSTQISVYNDAADTVDHKSTISDDGTTFTRGEFGSGP